MPMRLALPEDVVVSLVKPDASPGGERHQLRLVNRVERRMPFQEIGDTMTDFGRFHAQAGVVILLAASRSETDAFVAAIVTRRT